MILSIETSTKICSVALHSNGVLLAELALYIDKSHAEKLAVIIKDLLIHADITTKKLKAVAIAGGPGSYTGLRIGISTAKGLCFALKIPLISINTLKAMALGISQTLTEKNILLCPMLDARRMEVYSLLTNKEFKIIHPTKAKMMDENSYKEELKSQRILFFGNGAPKCKQFFYKNANAIFIEKNAISAKYVGFLAWKKFQKNNFENLSYYEPAYLKEFIAIKPRNLFA